MYLKSNYNLLENSQVYPPELSSPDFLNPHSPYFNTTSDLCPSDLELPENLKEMVDYTQIVDQAYGTSTGEETLVFADLGEKVGGLTNLVSGARIYNINLPAGLDYKDVVEHETFHKLQIKVAKEMGLNPEQLSVIRPYLEGQAAEILGQPVYESEKELYKEFMSGTLNSLEPVSCVYKTENGQYNIIYDFKPDVSLLKNYLGEVEEKAKEINLHPAEQLNSSYSF